MWVRKSEFQRLVGQLNEFKLLYWGTSAEVVDLRIDIGNLLREIDALKSQLEG